MFLFVDMWKCIYIYVYIRRPPKLGVLEYPCVTRTSYTISHTDILIISHSHILYLIAGAGVGGGASIPTTRSGKIPT